MCAVHLEAAEQDNLKLSWGQLGHAQTRREAASRHPRLQGAFVLRVAASPCGSNTAQHFRGPRRALSRAPVPRHGRPPGFPGSRVLPAVCLKPAPFTVHEKEIA